MDATREVGENIPNIQQVTDLNMKSMTSAQDAIARATGRADESGSALSSIVKLVQSLRGEVEGIASASEQQSATTKQVSRSTMEITRGISNTSSGMLESSQALQDLAAITVELKSTVDRLN